MNIVSGLREIAANYDAILCDVWGVVHNGQRSFAPACDALMRFRQQGGSVTLVTNAPRPNAPVRTQLAGLGAPRETYDDIVTSGDVTLARIAAHGNAPLHHIGPDRDFSLFEILREQTGLDPPRVSLAEADYVVCTGLFNDRAETLEDYDPALASMRARDLEFISANPDIVVHVGDLLLYCSGAIAERYAAIGGRVTQAGKPHAPIYEEAMQRLRQLRRAELDPKRVLAIGDGLRTDVKGACDFGLDCLFVTSGVHRGDLHAQGGLDAPTLRRVLGEAGLAPIAAISDLKW